jgi:LSD1 subclass zinc finger protein
MISFRCWYCNRAFSVREDRAGERFPCGGCKHLLRVPPRSGGASRVKTALDRLIEAVVYGGGGALLGLGLGLFILAQSRGLVFSYRGGWRMVVALTAVGFLAGTFGGERGVNWFGRIIRERTQR